MRAPRPAHGVESMGATVLWIMAALGPRPCPYDEMTPAEGEQRSERDYGQTGT